MPRPPKNKQPAVEPQPAPVPVAPAVHHQIPQQPMAVAPQALNLKQTPVIDVAQFIRVRDSVYQRLQTIQDLIRSFSQDYLRQTNLLIGEGTTIENGNELDRIASSITNLMPAVVPQPQPVVEEKKERKKRQHDPNAPKRPLTPYFLYMQTARPIIAADLGENCPKGAVQDEGQRRWSVMSPQEKLGWNQAYQYNLRLYNARVHAYKHGNMNAKNMTDEEARIYADQHNIPMPPLAHAEELNQQQNDQEAIAEQLKQTQNHAQAAAQAAPVQEQPASVEEEAPSAEEEQAPASKTPKKKETRNKRKSMATPAAPTPAAEPATDAKSAAATPASPETKKRKRVSKAAEQVEEPKKSSRKKSKSG
ncbi:putative high mobility group protein [Thermochaetoides thermophila DSM 1495]|uniref:Putative high mobility group protein n=1 Tax=Chaetomium thermophilum (strain DSM 1495 / CBS 144.50 / IMI 039719) TaxID=759272 RepID=G0SF24_CHATD|nr:putative high mobility group protein [Thermochaetoides thermophila DSM 1495]EGS18040.1 putative high mobility group protein [Thermochaetoides thermophila DSM 1495]